ncbi:cytidylyltransferase domain-containing protein [Clostridium neonatale]|uniref:acylneuraminate cytidylyltransferase family protein n=1 Tax=Clostridium neonatale TaxID=137838 RepID=UPI003D33B332
MNNEILAIIPARGGSKGLKRKNILDFMGKPLIAHTIEQARNSKYISRIIVSSEDEEIAMISKKYGAEIPFMRPNRLADDCSSTNEVIEYTLKELERKEGYKPDLICLLQCTSPLRTSEDIDSTINKLFNTNSDSAVSITEAKSNPYWTNILVDDRLEYFIEEGKQIKRRQDLPKIYELNGAVYVVKRETFFKEKTLETKNITGYVMKTENSIDIDNIIDLKIAEIMYTYNANRMEE